MQQEYFKFVFVLIIGVGVMASEIFKHYIKARKYQGNTSLADVKAENTALKQRIEVLEKLVTEDDFELKQQFKHL